jgi:long-chain acyl-CoA synthetase
MRKEIQAPADNSFRTLNELFLNSVAHYHKPDAFLSKRSGRYEGLSSIYALQQAAALAVALARLGIRRGDRIGLLSENRVEWTLTDYAALGMGAIDVPIYPSLPASEVEYLLRNSGARAVVVSTQEQLQKILAVKPRLPELVFTMVMDPQDEDIPGVHLWDHAIQDAISQTLDPERDFRTSALAAQPGDVATILYTSGTTGTPKGAILTHANIVSNVNACASLFQFTAADRVISFLPLCHIFERMLEYFVFSRGVSIAYAESFEKLPENLQEVRPTVMAVVPRVLEKVHGKIRETVAKGSPLARKLFRTAERAGWSHASARLAGQSPPLGVRLKHAATDKLVGAKIRTRLGGRVRFMISGSAPLSTELAQFFFAMGLPVYEGYGLTETSPVISVNYPGSIKLGTVGPVIAGVEVKISDQADGNASEAGGEILVRGPNVFSGYWELEEESRASFADGWFRTGDLGILDADRFLKITGRKKNLFKTSGGKYISPEKLEGLFQGHPVIAQVLTLGDARRFVAALIVPNFECLEAYARESGIAFGSREDLVRHRDVVAWVQKHVDEVCEGLAPFEKVRRIALLASELSIESGELSPSMKVRRFVVEERYREVIEELYLPASRELV